MISVANNNDIPSINTLINSAYRGDSSRAGWTTEADLLEGIRTDEAALKELVQQQGAVILKYEENQKLLGCVYLQVQGNKLYLGMLTVLPTLQNKGIGKILLAAAEEEAVKRNCNVVFMTVISKRKELIAWYEKRGYRNTGVTKPFPAGNPRFGIPKTMLEFVVLEKNL